MQRKQEEVNGHGRDEASLQVFSQNNSLPPAVLSNGFLNYQSEQAAMGSEEKSEANKIGSSNTHGEGNQEIARSEQWSRQLENNELGYVNDLLRLGMPKGQDYQNLGQNDSSYKPQTNRNSQTDFFEAEKSTNDDSLFNRGSDNASGSASANLPKFGNKLLPSSTADDITDRGGSYIDSGIKSEKTSKGSKHRKIKETTVSDISSQNQNFDERILSSPLTGNEKGQPINRVTRPRVRYESHPGSPKFVASPGVLSDDEYNINTSSMLRYGRRSAPIFTKRFSASEFWNSGQTSIERTHKQDLANARHPERQKSKSQSTNVMMTFPGKLGSRSSRLQRPNSTGPSSAVYTYQDQSSKGASHINFTSPAKTVGAGSYGSMDDAIQVVDHRGYHSELETAGWRHQDSSLLPGYQQSVYRDGLLQNDRISSKPDSDVNIYNDSRLENDVQDLSEVPRGHSMKGLFQPSHRMSPYDLHAKLIRGKDAMRMVKSSYEYIPEKEDVDIKKSSSSSDKSNEGSSSEEEETDSTLHKKTLDISEDKPEAKSETRTELYYRRWYLLALFSLTAMLWNAIWSTWGPIAQSAKDVYSWSDGDIAMFTYLGNIPFLITMFPCAYLMDVTGMRMAMIFCCSFMFAGAGFRCIPGDASTSTWFIRVGQFLNGVAGTVPMSGPALLSGLWFPPNQRATATAISTVAGYLGASISFVIGPLLVPEPDDLSPVNGTFNLYFSDPIDSNGSSINTTDHSDQEHGIKTILYAECVLAGLVFLLVLLYFPSKPPHPPSISASIPREKYVNGLKLLVRNKQFWICAIAFSVPIGVYESWQVILDINLDSKGISQQTAGWLDFYATVGGCVSGLLVSRFADLFTRQMKLFLLVFYAFATVSILWLTLVVLDIIPFDQVSIYAAVILAGVFLDGGSPLFFELTIEVSYPVGEGVTSGFTHMMCAAAGTIFLIIVQIESIGTQWMNWCFLVVVGSTIPLLLFINTTYSRADVDDMEIDISDDEEAVTGIGAADTNEKTSLLKNSSL